MEEKQLLIEFAIETAYLAGQITLGSFQASPSYGIKQDGSLITETDKQVEKFITDRIQRYYSEHSILGEEFGPGKKINRNYRWIIDPIDGTLSFVNGVPLYAVLIALEINGISTIGAAYFPALNEMLFAADGMGCYLNGRKIHVNDSISSLNDSIVTLTEFKSLLSPSIQKAISNITHQAKHVRGWGDAYGYLQVARGKTALHLDAVMKIWDCAPFLPIMKEAGGYFGDWKGNETINCTSSMATNKKLLPEVVDLLNLKNEVYHENSNF